MREARAFWVHPPGRSEIRSVALPEPGRDEVLVHTLYSGISRGTERLIFTGGVPPSQYAAMRAPFQESDLPGPVKYGYLNVGVVEAGPPALRGRIVFCLYPHQTAYVVPADAVFPVPDAVPPRRAVLAGTVETAVNALWDAAPLVGDRITVVGAGMVGCCVAALLARFPGIQVQLIDVDPRLAEVADELGVQFALPAQAATGRDLVFHASATAAGLQQSLDLLAVEGTVLASRGETFGMVIREALARGIPVLATAIGGLPEALGRAPDGSLPGLLVEPGDPAFLAEALRRWLDDASDCANRPALAAPRLPAGRALSQRSPRSFLESPKLRLRGYRQFVPDLSHITPESTPARC